MRVLCNWMSTQGEVEVYGHGLSQYYLTYREGKTHVTGVHLLK